MPYFVRSLHFEIGCDQLLNRVLGCKVHHNELEQKHSVLEDIR